MPMKKLMGILLLLSTVAAADSRLPQDLGSSLVLVVNKTIVIPGGESRVVFINGSPRFGEIDDIHGDYFKRAFCNMQVSGRILEAGRVIRVQSVSADKSPDRYIQFRFDDSKVTFMQCIMRDPYNKRYFTLEDLEFVLGDNVLFVSSF
jgi:hypothetical protein